MLTYESNYKKIVSNFPLGINDTDILQYLHKEKINWSYVQTLKKSTSFNDEVLSDLLNISVKTFRSYKKPEQEINDNIKEHVLLLLTLILHGKKVFGTSDKFEEWLIKENFFFDKKAPIEFLKTITGIRFIDDRLTAIEYGDNV